VGGVVHASFPAVAKIGIASQAKCKFGARVFAVIPGVPRCL
jgi:hypothetical protein